MRRSKSKRDHSGLKVTDENSEQKLEASGRGLFLTLGGLRIAQRGYRRD
jgi:hypothetical protein